MPLISPLMPVSPWQKLVRSRKMPFRDDKPLALLKVNKQVSKYTYCRCRWIWGEIAAIVSTIDERNVVLVEAERTTEHHVKTEHVTGKLQQTWKRPASHNTHARTVSAIFGLANCPNDFSFSSHFLWCSGRVADLRSTGRGFESQPPRCRVQPWPSC